MLRKNSIIHIFIPARQLSGLLKVMTDNEFTSGDWLLKEAMAYLAYGAIKQMNEPPEKGRKKFTGKEFDEEGGMDLSYFGARYLDVEVGRWTAVDPIPQYWDMYNYCGGNPVSRTDPDGSFGMIASGLVSAGMDVGIQMLESQRTGQDLDIDWTSVRISFGTGLVGAGVVSKAGKLGSLASLAINSAGNAANQYQKTGKVDALSMAIDVLPAEGLGAAGKAIMKNTGKYGQLAKAAERAERVNRNNPKPSRAAAAQAANKAVDNYLEQGAIAGAASGGLFSTLIKTFTGKE